jgi:hypothetical protein
MGLYELSANASNVSELLLLHASTRGVVRVVENHESCALGVFGTVLIQDLRLEDEVVLSFHFKPRRLSASYSSLRVI